MVQVRELVLYFCNYLSKNCDCSKWRPHYCIEKPVYSLVGSSFDTHLILVCVAERQHTAVCLSPHKDILQSPSRQRFIPHCANSKVYSVINSKLWTDTNWRASRSMFRLITLLEKFARFCCIFLKDNFGK